MRKLCLMGLALCMLAAFIFTGCDGPSGSIKSDGPAAPTGLGYETPTTVGGSDGKVTGTDPSMEYSLDVGKTWSSCTGDEITGLVPCVVLIRYAATESAEAGDASAVTVYDKNVTFKVTYDKNGETVTGTVPEDNTEYVPTGAVTVLGNTGNLAKINCTFSDWNTKADGSGYAYKAGDVFGITENTTLYAQWKKNDSLNGSFSISAGTNIYFSRGNMYYDGSEFKFEDNQYSFKSTWDTRHINHFFWSKDKSIACAAEYSDPNKSTSDVLFTNAKQKTIKSDFTVNGITGKYRILASSEWKYLLETRENAAEKVGYATVCGVNGIIILPDNFTDPSKNKGNGAFVPKATTGWTANQYDTAGWTVMEEAGAIFLPTTGTRVGTTVCDTRYSCNYLSSSPSSANNYSYDGMYFGYSWVDSDLNVLRDGGGSVRLVCAAE